MKVNLLAVLLALGCLVSDAFADAPSGPVLGHVQTRDHGVAPDGGQVPIAVTATGTVKVVVSDSTGVALSASSPLSVRACYLERDATLPCLTATALTGGDGGTVTLVTDRIYLRKMESGSDNARGCNSTTCTSYAAAVACEQLNDSEIMIYPGPSAVDGGVNPTFTFCAKTTAAPTVTFCPMKVVCL